MTIAATQDPPDGLEKEGDQLQKIPHSVNICIFKCVNIYVQSFCELNYIHPSIKEVSTLLLLKERPSPLHPDRPIQRLANP